MQKEPNLLRGVIRRSDELPSSDGTAYVIFSRLKVSKLMELSILLRASSGATIWTSLLYSRRASAHRMCLSAFWG